MTPKDKDATIARLTEQVNTLTTEKHADAEAIGALEAKLAEDKDAIIARLSVDLSEMRRDRDARKSEARRWKANAQKSESDAISDAALAEQAEAKLADAEARGFALLDENARLNAALLVLGAYLMEKGEAFRVGDGAELLDAYHAALSPVPQADPVREAAQVLLDDDISLSKMAEAVHDGPLGADDHWFSAATKQGAWCLDVVRAALRALAQKGGE